MTLACMTRFQVEERDTALDAAQGVLDFEERLWDNSRARLEAELLGALPPPGSPGMQPSPFTLTVDNIAWNKRREHNYLRY